MVVWVYIAIGVILFYLLGVVISYKLGKDWMMSIKELSGEEVTWTARDRKENIKDTSLMSWVAVIVFIIMIFKPKKEERGVKW